MGQRGDLTGAAAGRRDLLHAERLAQLKSSSYTVARPLALGAAAAGGTAAAHRALDRYGFPAGMAFALPGRDTRHLGRSGRHRQALPVMIFVQEKPWCYSVWQPIS